MDWIFVAELKESDEISLGVGGQKWCVLWKTNHNLSLHRSSCRNPKKGG